ncbi:substrate-binding domain-containing protein [Kineosporia sp. J2-2]|uniref:Substrate-binding domain-containing protein n=1 Tax=Kineosporia corallincola TaxID=2835133 RepID=A0ABS5TBW3_9ACTN|nr:substrate-binding domain-containing protein [Kineosporia corallincola]MBT0768567.1 substrate-binding domain-containing protein [Kineosporia corallincola]
MSSGVVSGPGPRVGMALLSMDDDGGLEPFYADLLAGLEEELDRHDGTVFLHVVPDLDAEILAYRRWADEGLVDAVVVSDLVDGDPRQAVCAQLGLPAVHIGGDPASGEWVVDYDNAGAMRAAVEHLTGLGHRDIGWVSGPQRYRHTRARATAFAEAVAAAGGQGLRREGDYGAGSGASLTGELLDAAPRPTAVVYDNDLMAVAGVREVLRRGLRVPQDVSILAWDDSANSRICHPPLSVVSRDVHELGVLTAGLLLRAVGGGTPVVETPPVAQVVARASTAAVGDEPHHPRIRAS